VSNTWVGLLVNRKVLYHFSIFVIVKNSAHGVVYCGNGYARYVRAARCRSRNNSARA